MRLFDPWRVAILGVALAGPAAAQVVWDMPGIIVPKPSFNTPTAQARPDVWPRLDRGAVLCRTEADLLRLAASRRGEPSTAPQCQIIRAPTPIQITRRAGPGRTQVSVTEQNQEGWTDAWLPEKAPPMSGKGSVIR